MSTPPPLHHVADFTIHVGAPVAIGETPRGLRRIVPILGGTVAGPRLTGTILPLGADFQVLRDDGFSELEAKYAFETADGEKVYIANIGMRHGPPDVMQRLARGEPVDPALIYFRTAPAFETDAPALNWLTRALFIGVGRRRPESVEMSVFEVG